MKWFSKIDPLTLWCLVFAAFLFLILDELERLTDATRKGRVVIFREKEGGAFVEGDFVRIENRAEEAVAEKPARARKRAPAPTVEPVA